MTEANTAKKYDGDKLRLDLLSPIALEEIARVLEFGSRKYDSWNWSKGLKLMRLYGAVLRHLFTWMRGETLDPESGLPHLAHAGCGIMFMIHLAKMMPSMDDRPVQAMSPESAPKPVAAGDLVKDA